MINKMKTRTGGYKNGVANSAKYLLKTDPKGDSIDSSIERLDGETDQAYANRIENIFESARVPNQKNLYQHNALAFHPSDGEKLTDAQMIDIAKEVYLKNGLGENRHYLFVVERNTDHPHVHALLHLTDLDTNRVNNKFVKYNPILEKLENKYGLYNEHRKPTPENTAPSNEKKTEKDLKKDFKTELKAILENALTASEFLMLADGAGFDITHNGKTAYSLTKDDQTFKASDLGMSYKTLKAALGDDPEFIATLALLHKEKPGNDGFGSIGYDFHDQQSAITERNIKNQRSNRVLDTRFDTEDGHLYKFKDSNRTAFSYSNGTARFNSISPMVIKAGLQKLTESGKSDTLHIKGDEAFKRVVWLQFHMMNLDKKGYSLKGYEPTAQDKAQLEKMKLENQAFKKPTEQNNTKSLPTEKPVEKTKDPKNENGIGGAAKAVGSKTVEIAASLLEGALDKMSDMTNSFSAGTMEEKLSEMRALDAGIRTQKNEAEDVYYQNQRRRRNMPRPD